MGPIRLISFSLLCALFLSACTPQETSKEVSCNELSFEACEEAEQCVWQYSDLDPQTLQIMSPSFCRDL